MGLGVVIAALGLRLPTKVPDLQIVSIEDGQPGRFQTPRRGGNKFRSSVSHAHIVLLQQQQFVIRKASRALYSRHRHLANTPYASMSQSAAILAADTARALARALLDLHDSHRDGVHCADVFNAWELLNKRMADAGLANLELRDDSNRTL